MSRSFQCPRCGSELEADAVSTGDHMGCPDCDGTFDLSSADASAYESAPIDVLTKVLKARAGAVANFADPEEIARGGMGAVLRCTDPALLRPVAMKVMKPELNASPVERVRFIEEAQLTGQLEHPNIVPIHELGQDADDKLFFTMKLVKGRSLDELLKADELSLAQLLNVFLKVCDGIAFAHSKQVIHRDLKPANVMVGDFGEVLVMDWGIAKVIGAAESAGEMPDIASLRSMVNVELTMQGAITGTPAYMSPEQAAGKIDQLDQRADIYSLGAILYEILTRERPIEGKNVRAVLTNVSRGKVVAPELRTPQRHIAKELSAIVMKAMSKCPDDRYPDVSSLAQTSISIAKAAPCPPKPTAPSPASSS